MKSVEKTLVLSFSGGMAVNASGTVRAAWDDAGNKSAAGEVKTQFIPGDPAMFIVQAEPSVQITRVLATAGEVQYQGEVDRPQTDELGWAAADDRQQLAWRPNGAVTPTWYGNAGSGLKIDGMTATVAGGLPCLARLAYTARVRSYRLQTPAVVLAKGQDYPLRVYIYYKEGN
jgi:hypothetical protein